jgi:hypothetical protein
LICVCLFVAQQPDAAVSKNKGTLKVAKDDLFLVRIYKKKSKKNLIVLDSKFEKLICDAAVGVDKEFG